ncbi:hypothetical protein VE02_08402 [Pseudogymnoascus sp. 03VT05]|nr:hypothetical protein VE02_08402 [Pseudogymnoascus sp. 03VT05]
MFVLPLDLSQYGRYQLLAIAVPILIVVYYTGLAIYRLYIHPLANYPGPTLWAISSIPGIRSLLNGRISFDYKELHDKYGPVVRVSPDELSFNTVEAWEDIYGHRVGKHAGRPNMDKDPIHVGSVEPILGASSLTMANDTDHARLRRALAYAFSQKALVEQEELLQDYVTKYIDNIRRFAEASKEFNAVDWFNYTTFDIIGDLSFGEPFGCLENSEGSRDWVVMIYESIKAGVLEQGTRRFADVGSWPQQFLLWLIPSKARWIRREHLRNSKEKALRRMNDNSEHKDFLWYIMKQREKKSDVSDDEVIINAALFIIAGSETTATLLAGLTNQLLRNPEKLKRVTAEIRSRFATEADLTFDNIMSLPYLNACFDESLRIFPPVPVGLLRKVPKGGDMIDSNFVPGGTSVSVPAWAASHSPANFKDPDTFLPERWMKEHQSEYGTDQKKASQPFSLGPRGCIGRHLSYVEMRLILGRLLWNFDIVWSDSTAGKESYRRWDPEGECKHLRAFNTWEKPPLVIKAIPAKRG